MAFKEIYKVLDEYARGEHGITLYDFGDGTAVMPIANEEGSWLTTSICYPMIRGEGKPTKLPDDNKMPMPEKYSPLGQYKDSDVIDWGNGWKIMALVIGYDWTAAQMREALEKAREKLWAEVTHG